MLFTLGETLFQQRLLAALYLYPFALFPLGLWSAIVGDNALGYYGMGWPLELQKSRQLLLGLCWGALIGVIFSFAIGQVEELGFDLRPNWLVVALGGWWGHCWRGGWRNRCRIAARRWDRTYKSLGGTPVLSSSSTTTPLR